MGNTYGIAQLNRNFFHFSYYYLVFIFLAGFRIMHQTAGNLNGRLSIYENTGEGKQKMFNKIS